MNRRSPSFPMTSPPGTVESGGSPYEDLGVIRALTVPFDDGLRSMTSHYLKDPVGELVKMAPAPDPNFSNYGTVLRPLMLSLRVLGVHVVDSPGGRRRKAGPCALAYATLAYLYLLGNVALSLGQIIMKQSRSNMLDLVAATMASVTAALLSGVMALNATPLRQLQHEMDVAFRHLPNSYHALKVLRRYMFLLTGIGWCFVVLRWTAMLNILDNTEPELLYLSAFQIRPPAHYSDAATYFVVMLNWTLQIVLVYGVLIFVPISFMGLCLLLAEAYREHNMSIVDLGQSLQTSGGPTAADFSRMRRLHERLCALVTCLDLIYGKNVFFWCFLIILMVCLDLTQLFTDDNLLRDMARDDLFFFSLRGVYSALTFIGTCVTAARVTEEAHAALPTIHALTLRSGRLTLDAKMEAQLFVCRLTAPAVGLTAWNFFTLDRNFILNIAAALTTYMVIVLQLNPKAMRAINSLVNQAINTTTGGNGTDI